MTASGLESLGAVIAFVLGLAFGSFANVVIYRMPRKPEVAGTVTRPSASYCPQCKEPIRFYDNIPLASYVLLGGRCRACGARIPLRYPLVELASAMLMTAAVLRFGVDVRAAVAAWFFWVLLVLAVVDGVGVPKLEYANPFPEEEDELPDLVHVLPDKLVLPSLVAALAFAVMGQVAAGTPGAGSWVPLIPAGLEGALGQPLAWAGLGGLAGGGFLLVLALLWRGGMGGGDIKLGALMGLVLGPWVLLAIFVGAAAGALASVGLIATGRRSRKDPIPFGPFLAAGGVITTLAGPGLVAAYLRAVGMA